MILKSNRFIYFKLIINIQNTTGNKVLTYNFIYLHVLQTLCYNNKDIIYKYKKEMSSILNNKTNNYISTSSNKTTWNGYFKREKTAPLLCMTIGDESDDITLVYFYKKIKYYFNDYGNNKIVSYDKYDWYKGRELEYYHSVTRHKPNIELPPEQIRNVKNCTNNLLRRLYYHSDSQNESNRIVVNHNNIDIMDLNNYIKNNNRSPTSRELTQKHIDWEQIKKSRTAKLRPASSASSARTVRTARPASSASSARTAKPSRNIKSRLGSASSPSPASSLSPTNSTRTVRRKSIKSRLTKSSSPRRTINNINNLVNNTNGSPNTKKSK
jgi:hypothetical protein